MALMKYKEYRNLLIQNLTKLSHSNTAIERRKISSANIVGLTVMIFLVVILMNMESPYKLNKPQKPQLIEYPTAMRVQIGKQFLENSMRDPASLEWSVISTTSNNAVCYEFSAKNEFGTMSTSSAVISSDGKQFKVQDEQTFDSLWKQECVSQHKENRPGSRFLSI
jgi:hypothetical protein